MPSSVVIPWVRCLTISFPITFTAAAWPLAARSVDRPAAVLARTDVIDRGDRYAVTVDLPGVKKEDIHVTVEGTRVAITAETKSQIGEKRRRQGAAYRAHGNQLRAQLRVALRGDRGSGRRELRKRRFAAGAAQARARRGAQAERALNETHRPVDGVPGGRSPDPWSRAPLPQSGGGAHLFSAGKPISLTGRCLSALAGWDEAGRRRFRAPRKMAVTPCIPNPIPASCSARSS
jgi:hypothetical protein